MSNIEETETEADWVETWEEYVKLTVDREQRGALNRDEDDYKIEVD